MCCKDKVFTDSISTCSETILVRAIFPPLSTHVWVVTDPFGNQYMQAFTADSLGYGSIDLSAFPEGFCNPSLPGFSIHVKATEDACDFEGLVFPVTFEKAQVKITGGSAVKEFVGCAIDLSVITAPSSIEIIATEDGPTISDPDLAGKIVSFITTETQSYNRTFWSKPEASDTLTGTNITFSEGQVITVYFYA